MEFSNVAFGIRIAEGRVRGCLEDSQVVGFQYPVHGCEAGVPVVNQIPAWQFPILDHHREVPGLLRHPGAVRLRRAASNPHPAAAQMQKEQYVEGHQPAQGPNLFGQKIRRPAYSQVRLEKLLPRQAPAIGSRRQAIAPEHVAHVAGAGFVSEFL